MELVFSNSTISANVLVIHPQALKEGGLNAGVIGDDEKSFLDSLSHMSSGKFWELFHLISTSFGVGLCKAVFSEPRIITKEVNISFFSNLTLDDQLSLSLIRSIMSSLILNPSTLHHLAKIVTTFPLGFVCEILGHMLGLLSEDASNLWLFLLFAEKINPVPPRDCMAFRNSVFFSLAFAYYDKIDKCVAIKIFFEKFFKRSVSELSKTHHIAMFCWRLVHFPESQDLDTMQEDNISSLDDILAHLIILFAHDRASLLNHIVQMFQKIGIHVAVDTPSFNEVLSSLCFSVLFKLFNLFLSFTHANWKQKVALNFGLLP